MKIFGLLFLAVLFVLHESEGGNIGWTRSAGVDDNDLMQLSEQLLSKDVPNENGQVTVNLQNKVYSNTPSRNPLLQYAENPGTRQPQTYTLLQRLFREYESGRNVARAKEDFLNAIMETDVMKETINFLNSHGNPMTKSSLKAYIDNIWFTPYNRGGGQQSSGFQHVFMAELKNNNVNGLHNWLFFLEQEKLGNLKYIGWTKFMDFRGYPSSIVKMKFTWKGAEKPSGSLFIGTSPELEMALYSLCFMYRQQQDCKLSLGNVPVYIKTHTFNVRGNNLIGSAYPAI